MQEILERNKCRYYTFEPYFNRGTSVPSFQWKVLAAAPKYKGRMVLAGNRTGKTECAIYEACLAITGRHPTRNFPKNGQCWIVALDYKMVESIDLPMFNEFMPEKYKERWHGKDMYWEIKRPEDGGKWRVGFMSSDAGREKFQSAKLDFVVFDEEPTKMEIMAECEARLIDRAGIWWMAATPIRGTASLKKLSEREDVFAISASMTDNPYIPEEEVRKFAANLTEDEMRVRVLGEYLVFGGNPVFNIRILNNMLDKANRTSPTLGILEAA